MFQVGGKGGRHYRTLDEAKAAAETIRQRKGIVVSIVEQPEPEPRPHYHIGNGTPGCLFDSVTGPYANHRDAERAASRESRDHKADHDAWAGDDEPKMKRFVRNDANGRPALYLCVRVPYGSQYYWEIFPCSNPACLVQGCWEGW